uniref:Uncharacterized protein n=1 Tax=Arundo donax TaxID=35708 RepID=A0A0A9BQJ1_ARUDO
MWECDLPMERWRLKSNLSACQVLFLEVRCATYTQHKSKNQ